MARARNFECVRMLGFDRQFPSDKPAISIDGAGFLRLKRNGLGIKHSEAGLLMDTTSPDRIIQRSLGR